MSGRGSCEEATAEASWSPPELSDLYPTGGPVTGGTQLVVAVEEPVASLGLGELGGTLFPAAGLVLSSGEDCARVSSETCVLGTAPDLSSAYAAGDRVDVVVELDGGEVLALVDGFTLHEDRSGQVVLFGRSQLMTWDDSWFSYGSPYVDVGSATRFLQVDFVFHEPLAEEDHVYSAYAQPGECSNGTYSYTRVNVGDVVELDGNALLMEDAQHYWWVETEGLDSLYGRGLDLEVQEQGTSTVEPQLIQDAFTVPELLVDSNFDDPSAADFVSGSFTLVRGEDLVLEWTAAQDLDGLGWESAAVEGYTELLTNACTEDPDPGTLTLPWSELVTDPNYDEQIDGITLMLRFWKDQKVVLPHDNSTTWTRETLLVWTYVTVVDE